MSETKIPEKMAGVVLTGHGGFDCLEYREDIPVPSIGQEEVLIRVGACGVNNTDINTRIGWYSKTVTRGTDSGGADGFDETDQSDAGWSGEALSFPRIQGADVAGRIVAVGKNIDPARIGERVLVRTIQDLPETDQGINCSTVGSETDGGFARFTKAPASQTFVVNSGLTDIELASFPCAYSTAENLVDRAGVTDTDTVLITGASGGVGSAAVQLAKRRGAEVIAVCGKEKADRIKEIGADRVVDRNTPLTEAVASMTVEVVIDLVGGPQWPDLTEVLKRGGRYAVAGAIAGPMVTLDLRTLYLKDITFFGCTWQPRRIFENLVGYIERGELTPLVSSTYPLKDIQQAQTDFLSKRYPGKLVLYP